MPGWLFRNLKHHFMKQILLQGLLYCNLVGLRRASQQSAVLDEETYGMAYAAWKTHFAFTRGLIFY